jgi:serine phosphatase RsbU (regulator of sigma subunit)
MVERVFTEIDEFAGGETQNDDQALLAFEVG